MWEHHKIKHYKALAHANPGGYTYSDGWSQLIKSAAKINDEDTKLREAAAIRAELKRIGGEKHGELYDLDSPNRRAWAAGLGGLALLVGAGLLLTRDRRKS
jgi:hydroxylamine dehydrogenase